MLTRVDVLMSLLFHIAFHVCSAYQNEMKKNMNIKDTKRKRAPQLPQPIRGAPSTATHLPRIGMCSLCMGTFFVVASMVLLSWNEVR